MKHCEWCDDRRAEFVYQSYDKVCERCMIDAIRGDKPEDYEALEHFEERKAKELAIEKSRSDFIDEVISWSSEANPDSIRTWESILRRYLIDMGWDNAAIADFVNMGDGGFNYGLLHIETFVGGFYLDVHYCSDKMSMDRLLRCHIQYRTIVREEKTHNI